MRFQATRHAARKFFAVNSQGASGGNRAFVGGAQNQGVEAPHFPLEKPRRFVERVRFERVRANQLRQIGCLMDFRLFGRAHFIQTHARAALRRLPRGFASGESAADDG